MDACARCAVGSPLRHEAVVQRRHERSEGVAPPILARRLAIYRAPDEIGPDARELLLHRSNRFFGDGSERLREGWDVALRDADREARVRENPVALERLRHVVLDDDRDAAVEDGVEEAHPEPEPGRGEAKSARLEPFDVPAVVTLDDEEPWRVFVERVHRLPHVVAVHRHARVVGRGHVVMPKSERAREVEQRCALCAALGRGCDGRPFEGDVERRRDDHVVPVAVARALRAVRLDARLDRVGREPKVRQKRRVLEARHDFVPRLFVARALVVRKDK
mmetsp:Transcript_26336/g.86429  ORF Transcript_26336/g.86429 Transcript_26336/m.86429 type:complete len:277 (-) Transcript_26336:191-1021(-)